MVLVIGFALLPELCLLSHWLHWRPLQIHATSTTADMLMCVCLWGKPAASVQGFLICCVFWCLLIMLTDLIYSVTSFWKNWYLGRTSSYLLVQRENLNLGLS